MHRPTSQAGAGDPGGGGAHRLRQLSLRRHVCLAKGKEDVGIIFAFIKFLFVLVFDSSNVIEVLMGGGGACFGP